MLTGLGTGLGAMAFGLPALAASPRKLAVLPLGSHAPGFIASERGYFQQAGLAIELKFFEAAQPMAVAIASGDADFSVTVMSGGLVSLAHKNAIKVVGGALMEEKGLTGSIILALGLPVVENRPCCDFWVGLSARHRERFCKPANRRWARSIH